MSYEVARAPGHAPMRVVARLEDPIGYLDDLLHLDGLIAQGAYRELDERTRRTMPTVAGLSGGEWPITIDLPLSTWWVDYDPVRHGDIDTRLLKRSKRGTKGPPPRLWGWCATAECNAWPVRDKIEVRKKPPLKEMRRYTDARSHNTSSGHMKAYDLAIPTVLARDVVWYALGDLDRVRYLLTTHIPAIGKKRNLGCGGVREWIVEAADVETDGVCVAGELKRRVPDGACEGAPQVGTIRPPYWHPGSSIGAVGP